MKICGNCAWYCHSNGMCYVPVYPDPVIPCRACSNWSADGLDDQEREDLDALMTMEKNDGKE